EQVLDHVRGEQLVGELVDGWAERDREHDEARGVATLPPSRNGTALARERAYAGVIGQPVEEDQDRQPDAAERADGREGERQGVHGHQRSLRMVPPGVGAVAGECQPNSRSASIPAANWKSPGS